MPGGNLFSEIARVIGVEKASALELGEAVEGEDAWLLLDYIIENKDTRVLDEDESVDGVDCYHVAILVEGSYLFYLVEESGVSRCVLRRVSGDSPWGLLEKLEAELGYCRGD
ncbi:MAG: hypothetical protein GU348_05925 [Thermogladius sp.]|jgi:hypothetical protein|nr:hypothetical protein [Thermogladius sp.]